MQAAGRKRALIEELRLLVATVADKEAEPKVKDINARWKSVGFIGEEATQSLNQEYFYYANKKQYWDEWAINADCNRDYARNLVAQMKSYADGDNPSGWSNTAYNLIAEFRAVEGSMRKQDREEMNREFWAAKDRFCS